MISADALTEAREEIHRLKVLVEASKLINSSIEPRELFESILQVAREQLGVERGTLYFVDGARGEVWGRIADPPWEIHLPIGQGLAGTVAVTGETVILQDAPSDPRFDRSVDQRTGYTTRSMLCVPIKNRRGKIVGVLQLLNKTTGDFGAKDVEFLESVSDHMAIAMQNATVHLALLDRDRMERELLLGREIQSRLLADAPTDVPGTELAAVCRSCYEVGGDYYDFDRLPNGVLGLAIGDVSGKGVAAALIMSTLQAALRVAGHLESDLVSLVARLDALIRQSTQGRKYVTLFLARYDPASGALQYVNAGHNPPILYYGGEVRLLKATGRPIGLLPGQTYQRAEVTLPPGAMLCLYTDGLTEAVNKEDEEFGLERLTRVVAESDGRPLGGLIEHLLDTITAYESGAPSCDDKTLVMLRRA